MLQLTLSGIKGNVMKIKNIFLYLFLTFVLATALVSTGCNLGIYSGPANVKLNLGDAKALAPSGITSVTLTISGPDMDTITKTYTPEDLESPNGDWTIDIQLSPGTDRLFEVSATLSSDLASNPTAILEYYGKAKQNITEEAATITIHMGISKMRIVTANPNVPATEPSGFPSIVSTDDLGPNWTNWTRIKEMSSWGDATGGASFVPWDIDIEEDGSLIIANNGGSGGAILWRMSSISPVVYAPILTLPSASGLVAVAVDRENKLIYFADDSANIYSCDYSGQIQKTYNQATFNFSNITGLAVDDSGILYISNGANVTKFDPTGTGSVSATKTITGSSSAKLEDVMFKSIDGTGYIYVTDSANKQIVKLKVSDLSIVGSYTNASFYGPRRFVATLNSGIYFTDEYYSTSTESDQLIYMDDIDGTNLKKSGAHGFGDPGEFSFQYGQPPLS